MSTPPIIRWDQAYNRNGDKDLPRTVVNVIRTYMDNRTLEGWVKRSTLMRDTGLSERQVDRQIAANVKAGWLEITSRGHSAGKSNDYRLTHPKADISVAEIQTDLSMQTYTSAEGRHGRLPDTDISVCPTTPRTSPGTSPKRSTTPESDTDIYDCLRPDPFVGSGSQEKYPLPDPWSGSGGVDTDLPPGSTTPSDTDIYDCISQDTGVSIGREKFLAALANGPVPVIDINAAVDAVSGLCRPDYFDLVGALFSDSVIENCQTDDGSAAFRLKT